MAMDKMTSENDWRRDPRSYQENYHRRPEQNRNNDRQRRFSPPRHRDQFRNEYRDRDRDRSDEYHHQGRDHRAAQRYYDRDREYDREYNRPGRRYSPSRSRSPRRPSLKDDSSSHLRDDRRDSGQRDRQIPVMQKRDQDKPTEAAKGIQSTDKVDGKKDEGAAKAKKKKTDASAAPSSTKLQNQFNLWTKASDQVHGVNADPGKDAGAGQKKRKLSYADFSRNCCLLCRRRFADQERLRKHERRSKLHRDNMRDHDKRQAAYKSLMKHGIVAPERAGARYVDRAKERRQLHHQPSRPKHSHRPAFNQAPKAAETEVETPQESKAAAMMSKMGWSQGEGLGADGTGNAKAIEATLYAQGVGLGAAGGKVGDALEEADRSTRGDYNSKGWDKTRERFESMQ